MRPSSPKHKFDTLGSTSRVIDIMCAECGIRRRFDADELRRVYGPDYRMIYLRYDLAACPKQRSFRDCAVRYAPSD
jgi:hypothetical protein